MPRAGGEGGVEGDGCASSPLALGHCCRGLRQRSQQQRLMAAETTGQQ
jgi:hypothetical protein